MDTSKLLTNCDICSNFKPKDIVADQLIKLGNASKSCINCSRCYMARITSSGGLLCLSYREKMRKK